MDAAWQHEYASASEGSTTRFFFPTIFSIRTHRDALRTHSDAIDVIDTTFQTTQIFTGHGFHKSYLRRFHITQNDACPCSVNATQDIRHVLENCKIDEDASYKYMARCIKQGIDPFDFPKVVIDTQLSKEFSAYAAALVGKLKDFNAQAA